MTGRGSMKRLAILTVVLTGLAACGGGGMPDPPAGEQQLIASPNGEPLGYVSDSGKCQALLTTWFNTADSNRDGQLSQAELEADAQRWFQRADSDGDGYITVLELTAIRQPMEPPPRQRMVRRGPNSMNPFRDDSDLYVRREPDPVMAADVNLDFRVSRDELMALVARRYATATRQGPFDRAAVLRDCERRRFGRQGGFF